MKKLDQIAEEGFEALDDDSTDDESSSTSFYLEPVSGFIEKQHPVQCI